ncbi:hypothetical protein [Devosia sp. Naph2]|uniref:hypothetical protein n=1 Tax=Devosia polycyclovorans TaxID=3345148 RepID=UPI0035CF2EBF
MDFGGSGEPRLLPPLKHLIEILEAFGRHMAVRDRKIYNLAINGINAHVDGETRVEGAVVVPAESARFRDEVDLSQAADLGELRADLHRLIGNFRETPAIEVVPMHPPSEYWLAYNNPKGRNYGQSPAHYGMVLKHIDP